MRKHLFPVLSLVMACAFVLPSVVHSDEPRKQGREVWEGDPDAPDYQPWLKPPEVDDMIPVEVGGEVLYLTPQEHERIELRRQLMLRETLEEMEAQRLRQMLGNNQRDESLRRSIQDRFPLSPDEIKVLRERDLGVQEAQNRPVVDVESIIRTMNLDIDDNKPFGLYVSRGFISSMVFYDQSGNPWPIKGDVIGDESAFGSRTIGEENHIAVFEIKRSFAQSNALIYLEGLNVPLSVRLMGAEGKVDARLSVRVPRFGPQSGGGGDGLRGARMAPEVRNAPQQMIDLLGTGRIEGAREFTLEGIAGRAFFHDGNLYIRSKSDLVIPPIQPPMSQEIVSPTGYNVYRIPPVTQLTFSENGSLVPVRVREKPQVDIRPKQSIFEE